jgi:hypothetical protein
MFIWCTLCSVILSLKFPDILKIQVPWDVTTCQLVNSYLWFKGSHFHITFKTWVIIYKSIQCNIPHYLELKQHFCDISDVAFLDVQGGAGKSLARPGRKQATGTKLVIYSTYSPWSSIHFLASCSNFWKTLKKNSETCQSNHVSVAAMTSTSDKKWRPLLFQSREQVVV